MIAAVRVRGRTGVKKGIQDTMSMLKLTRLGHLVFLHEDATYKGMLVKAKMTSPGEKLTWKQSLRL